MLAQGIYVGKQRVRLPQPKSSRDVADGADILPMGGVQMKVARHDLEVEAGRVDLASGWQALVPEPVLGML